MVDFSSAVSTQSVYTTFLPDMQPIVLLNFVIPAEAGIQVSPAISMAGFVIASAKSFVALAKAGRLAPGLMSVGHFIRHSRASGNPLHFLKITGPMSRYVL
jgi:hypothetical protein